eukprot:CFRG4809T1
MHGVKAVILVGGPSQGMRYKSLSMHAAKPLFPIAGKPMIQHHMEALSQIKNLEEVLMIGYYDDQTIGTSLSFLQEHASFKIRYLPESKGLGTAGGMYFYRDEILRGDPDMILVMHIDVTANFPLNEMIDFHRNLPDRTVVSVLGVKMDPDSSLRFGCMAVDSNTQEMLHYMEKPKSHISNIINGGVYVFDPSVFDQMERGVARRRDIDAKNPYHRSRAKTARFDPKYSRTAHSVTIFLEQDVLIPLGSSRCVYVFPYDVNETWTQVKTSENVIQANREILARYKAIKSPLLTFNDDVQYTVVGNCIVHKTASVDRTAKIGPDAVIGPRTQIMAGARVSNSIVMEDAIIEEHACVLNAIIGMRCTIGQWSRVQGSYTDEKHAQFFEAGKKLPGIASLGAGVIIDDEVIVRDCIVLPDQHIQNSYHNEIL